MVAAADTEVVVVEAGKPAQKPQWRLPFEPALILKPSKLITTPVRSRDSGAIQDIQGLLQRTRLAYGVIEGD